MGVNGQIDFNEKARLQSLYQYDVLDTEREKEYDDLTELATSICDAPISRINLIDKNRRGGQNPSQVCRYLFTYYATVEQAVIRRVETLVFKQYID